MSRKTALTIHDVLFSNWAHIIIFSSHSISSFLAFFVPLSLSSCVPPLGLTTDVVLPRRPWLRGRKERNEENSSSCLLKFMRLLEHSHFIIAHRNLISTLCFHWTRTRSFYDVNDNSFLLSLSLSFLLPQSHSNRIRINHRSKLFWLRLSFLLFTLHRLLFHVDCTYLKIGEYRSWGIVCLVKE